MPEHMLTRRGARDLTEAIDRVATAIQHNADVLGIDPEVALDYAKRSDMISDAVETTAGINYPVTAGGKEPAEESQLRRMLAEEGMLPKSAAPEFSQPPRNETGDSVEPGGASGAGWDPNAIADDRGGPYKSEPDESYMAGEFAQKQFHELRDKQQAGGIAGVDKFAKLLREAENLFTAASKLPDIAVAGYAGLTDQIRALEILTTQAQELAAKIDALLPPDLLSEKKLLDKDMKKIHETIKKEYKTNLTAIGNITIQRKTKLVDVQAMLKVTERRRSLNDVQAEVLEAVIEKHGKEVSEFISTTTEALRDTDKKMVVAWQGFELEHRVMEKTGSVRTSGLADLLARFQSLLAKGWRGMVSVVQAAATLVMGADKAVERAHDDLMSVLKDINSGRSASSDVEKESSQTNGGFNLFA